MAECIMQQGEAPRLWGRGALWRASHSVATVDAPSAAITEVCSRWQHEHRANARDATP